VTTKDSKDDVGIDRIRSPIAAGAISLAIYIAMYLAVAGVIRAITSPGAAIAPDSSMTHASAATTSNPAAGAGDSDSRPDNEPSADRYPIRRE
jgi:hypothetical protein